MAELAPWLGLVPRQHSTGGMPTLMGISKRGDCYLRTLLIHGGRTVVRVAHLYTDKRNLSVSELDQRRGKNISAVAVANKKCTPCMGFIKQEGILCGNCHMICYFYSTVIVMNT